MSEVQTVTLTDFLLARIVEQEAAIRAGGHGWIEVERYIIRASDGPIVFTEERALAQCAAERRIVEQAQRTQASLESRRAPATDAINGHVIAYRDVVRRLAAIYADHPDYRDEWKP